MRSVFISICLVLGFSAISQPLPSLHSLVLTHLSEQDGLSDNQVQCVLQDNAGLVWVGTADGLNQLNGSEIRVFRSRPGNSLSLQSNNILCLQSDSSGNIWMGTPLGLGCYERRGGKFVFFEPPLSPYGTSAYIQSLYIDPSGRIWCGTDGGLMEFDTRKQQFKPYFNSKQSDPENPVYRNKIEYLTPDQTGRLLICTYDGLWAFDPGREAYSRLISRDNDSLYDGLISTAYEDSRGRIWAWSWKYGLKELDPQTQRVFSFPGAELPFEGLVLIKEIRLDDGKSYIAVNGPLQFFDPDSRRFFRLRSSDQDEKVPDMSPCLVSADQSLWLGSRKNGLYLFNPKRQVFRHWLFPEDITTQQIAFLRHGETVFVGAQGKDLFCRLDEKKETLLHPVSWVHAFNRVSESSALAFYPQGPDSVWMSSSEGLACLLMKKQQVRWYRHHAGDSSSLPRNFITSVLPDHLGKLWIFPWREGIWQLDPRTGKCVQMLDGFIPEDNHRKKLLISQAAEDNEGNIWMADLDEGIVLYERKTGRFSKPFEKILGPRLRSRRIFFRHGKLYANSNFSLIRWDPRSRKLKSFTPPADMMKEIHDVYPDAKGRWWMACHGGLICLDETRGSFRRFTSADGLHDDDMDGTLFCLPDGDMILGAPGYFTRFNPDQLLSAASAPGQLLLTGISVNERAVPWDSSQALELDYRSNNIEFSWALTDYTNPLHNEYYSLLDGIDSTWKLVGSRGDIRYANLSPGEYRQELRAASSNGQFAPGLLVIRFVIHPPFWKNPWYLLLFSLTALTSLVLLIRYISQARLKERLLTLEKEQAVEKERNRISRDVHDDLGSGLTKIAIMTEVAKKRVADPELTKQQLDQISESSRLLVDSLQDIIWVLNPRNDSLESLAAYIREYALKYFEPFETRIQFHYPDKFPDLKLSEEQRRNLFLVVKETFHNCCKHAWCNQVDITIRTPEGNCYLEIRDDGKGFDPQSVRAFANGLQNMSLRIRHLGGSFEIESAPGQGTCTKINLPS